MEATKFQVNDEVYKIGGRYGGPCWIAAVTCDLDEAGYRLYSCVMKVEGGYGEFVHVFPENALSTTPDPRQIAANDFAGMEEVAGPAEVKPIKEETVEFPGYLMTQLLGSGWAAVHMVKVTVRKPGEEPYTYEDVQQTGIGRYATIREAWVEAKMWSQSDEIPFDEDEPAAPVAKPKKFIPL